MEKFAVDLDKVLDDFELNEDQAERFAAKSKPPLPLPKVLPQPLPAQPLLGRLHLDKRDAHYEGSERPLRRINLLDADFAPDPHPKVLSFCSGSEKSTVAIDGPSPLAYPATPIQPPLANGQSAVEEEEAEEEQEEEQCGNGDGVVSSTGGTLGDSYTACLPPPTLPPPTGATACMPYPCEEQEDCGGSQGEDVECRTSDFPVSDGCDSAPSSSVGGGGAGLVRSPRDCLSGDVVVVVPVAPDSDRPVAEEGDREDDGHVPCSGGEEAEEVCSLQQHDSVPSEQSIGEKGGKLNREGMPSEGVRTVDGSSPQRSHGPSASKQRRS